LTPPLQTQQVSDGASLATECLRNFSSPLRGEKIASFHRS
jgi:hypothetical protein